MELRCVALRRPRSRVHRSSNTIASPTKGKDDFCSVWDMIRGSTCPANSAPSTLLIENVDAVDLTELHLPGRDGVVACIAEHLEDSQATDARVVRTPDHLWLRIWQSGRSRRSQPVRDLLFALRSELAALSAQGKHS